MGSLSGSARCWAAAVADLQSLDRPHETTAPPAWRAGLVRTGASAGWAKAGWWAVAAIIVILVALPTIYILSKAFGEGGYAFSKVRDIPGIGKSLVRTALLGVCSSVLALLLGLMLAWHVSRLSGRTKSIAAMIPVIPLLIPAPVLVIGWMFLLSPQVGYANQLLRKLPLLSRLDSGPFDVYTMPWIILITAMFLTPFVYFFVSSALESLGSDFKAAASSAGASPLRVFFTVVLPLLRPSLVYAFAIALVLGSGQFTAPLLLGRQQGIDVLTTEIFKLSDRYPVQYGLGGMLSLPLIVLGVAVVILQRRAIGDQRRYVVGREVQHDASRASRWHLAPVIGFALLLLLPLLGLLHVAFSPFWSGELTFSSYTLDHFHTVLGDSAVIDSLVTSLVASLVAIAIIVPLTFMAALAVAPGSKAGRLVRTVIDIGVNVPLGIPATVFGFGVLFAYSQRPFNLYGTVAIIVIVYTTIMLPFAMRLQLSVLQTQGLEYQEAAATSGASRIRTLLTVVAPLARSGIVAAVVLTFVLLMHEFSASLLVMSPTTQVMGALLFRYYTAGTYPEVAVLSLLLVAVTVIGVGIAMAVGGRDVMKRIG